MADNYGVTFAQKQIQRGDYEAALASADKHAQQDPDNPEPYHDRARALALLGQYERSVADYAHALLLDKVERVLSDWEVDDGLFSTLVAWGQSLGEPGKASTEQVAIMQRYRQLLPDGQHLQEAEQWILRFRGLLKSTFVKPKD
ncbi:MAG TPA: tetratricopeptide repeat protein [Pseudomonadota bacterium]|jgi:tetratricopeptide (TPR) repeat protein|nr:tetratricopeptide repeat protein [Pseudomonadota bacterium]HNN53835.1 tetratricopeptide repeat protein [Pseudomonadota bacterium]